MIGVQNENGHSHTMLFEIDKDRVINGNAGGDARYLNHGCDPNCETVQDGDRIFIEALRSIKTGEELCYDYHLQVPGKITDKVRKEYACFCGSPKCRGTQIAPEILAKQAKKDEKKAEKKAKGEAKAKSKSEVKNNKAEAKPKAKAEAKAKVEKKAKTEAKDKVKSEVKANAKNGVKKAEAKGKKKKAEGKLSKKDKKKDKKKNTSSSLMVETAGLSNKNKKKKKDKKKK